jgi:hypothetical protein
VWYGGDACASKYLRHAICVFGVEDLKTHIDTLPHLFVNKMMPEYDFSAVGMRYLLLIFIFRYLFQACWYERLFNRSHIDPPTTARLNPHYYLNLAHVRFQYLKDKNGVVSPQKLKTFDCRGKQLESK